MQQWARGIPKVTLATLLSHSFSTSINLLTINWLLNISKGHISCRFETSDKSVFVNIRCNYIFAIDHARTSFLHVAS